MRLHYIGLKAKAWKYEVEIRLVKSVTDTLEIARSRHNPHSSPMILLNEVKQVVNDLDRNGLIDRKKSFDRASLMEIKFGVNSSQSSIEEIRRITDEYGYDVKLKKAVVNKRKFGIYFIDC